MSPDYIKDSLQEQNDIRKAAKRVCTDCGKPTHNYRCDRCWKKKRGYGFEDSGDETLVTREARQRMLLNGAEAKRERKEHGADALNWFVPSKKYGTSPPPPPPGEQKRLAPAMPAKGHAGQWREPPSYFWMPRKRTKESSMANEKRTYTVKELASLIGVSPKDVQNAKFSPAKEPIPGSKNHTIRQYMTAEGITWDQVVRAPGKYTVLRKTDQRKSEQSGFANTRPTPELAQKLGIDLNEEKAALSAIEEALTQAVAEMEPGELASAMEPGVRRPGQTDGALMASVLDTPELEGELAWRVDGGGAPDRIGLMISTEELLFELKRRLPQATVTVTL